MTWNNNASRNESPCVYQPRDRDRSEYVRACGFQLQCFKVHKARGNRWIYTFQTERINMSCERKE